MIFFSVNNIFWQFDCKKQPKWNSSFEFSSLQSEICYYFLPRGFNFEVISLRKLGHLTMKQSKIKHNERNKYFNLWRNKTSNSKCHKYYVIMTRANWNGLYESKSICLKIKNDEKSYTDMFFFSLVDLMVLGKFNTQRPFARKLEIWQSLERIWMIADEGNVPMVRYWIRFGFKLAYNSWNRI